MDVICIFASHFTALLLILAAILFAISYLPKTVLAFKNAGLSFAAGIVVIVIAWYAIHSLLR